MSDLHPEAAMGQPAHPVVRVLPAAPELAAAMAETGKVRARLAELCEEFGPSAQSGWSARVSLTVLNRYRADAGIDRLSRTPSNDREDTMLRYRRERDEAREQLATCRERNAAIATQSDAYRDQRDNLHNLTGTILREFAAHTGEIRAWAQEAGIDLDAEFAHVIAELEDD